MNLPSIVLWGFAATVVLFTMMAGAQSLGLTRIRIPFLLGTMVTASRDRAMLTGLLMHIVNGAFRAYLRLRVRELAAGGLVAGRRNRAGAWPFALAVAMPIIPAMHPRMVSEYFGPTPNRQLQPPGFLALNYGARQSWP